MRNTIFLPCVKNVKKQNQNHFSSIYIFSLGDNDDNSIDGKKNIMDSSAVRGEALESPPQSAKSFSKKDFIEGQSKCNLQDSKKDFIEGQSKCNLQDVKVLDGNQQSLAHNAPSPTYIV